MARALRFRQFFLRGLNAVFGEWTLVSIRLEFKADLPSHAVMLIIFPVPEISDMSVRCAGDWAIWI